MTAAWPRDRDVFAYWNNDFRGCAPRDAGMFARLAAAARVPTTRAPNPDELPVGEELARAGQAPKPAMPA